MSTWILVTVKFIKNNLPCEIQVAHVQKSLHLSYDENNFLEKTHDFY